ncbi:NOG1 family protein [Natronobacterium gregoryi]|uniref:GTP-binding protein n=2 Tax=Natronobacterium gregoryi TaxID=44930 RepID=L0AJI9_NATGS|nr:NOG1 family protein [Natronobacterium gregoryi]AFZ73210.1 putative GTPase [Natronobacterium gregoryi SP2]ELY71332.1 small GTP-binding protein [Natronobacterium gregoryi SP2]PLK21617.1 GTP-binding protein [Natronobacterium gregoryi SP2]SFI58341.1 nucleolar GTP-binding protein [Natronobacterium gregoryi]
MIFEDLPTTPTSEELIDKAFSRAARAGKAQGGLEAQQSMLQTASNIVSDNLENVVTAWPDFEYEDDVHPFYYELADVIVDVDELRQSLSEVMWASRKAREIHDEYQPRLRKTDVDTARKHRKQAFARLADIVEQIDDDLLYINEARNDLRDLPDIDPEEPTIVVAGYPNVGKSSFVNDVTRARGETASYPFTTKGIGVGHLERDHIRYQLVDTPGLLDRPPEDRNKIESQAVSAIEHLADCMVVMVDPSGECGYPLESQLELRDSIGVQFEEVPVLTVANKSDRVAVWNADTDEMAADYTMSVETDENVETVLEAAVAAVDYEPELPFEE